MAQIPVKNDETLPPVKRPSVTVNNNYLPMELVSNILIKLHVKALCLCKCISREWRRTISDPQFVARKRSLVLKKPILLFLRFEYGEDQQQGKNAKFHVTTMDIHQGRVYDYFIKNADFEIAGKDFRVNMVEIVTCYDLVLFVFGTDPRNSIKNIYLCNPSTQQFIPIQRKYDYLEFGFSSVSIGYIPSKDEYKLVLLWHDIYGTLPEEESFGDLTCEISTIVKEGVIDSADCLKVIKIIWPFEPTYNGFWLQPHSPICIDGVMYWIVQDIVEEIITFVLSVDLETGGYEVIPCFNITDQDHSLMYLRELKNSLCVVNLVPDPRILEIWSLKKLEKYEWRLEHTIDLSELVECNDPTYNNWYLYDGSYPVNIIHEDVENDEILLDVLYESLYYYNLNSRTFRRAEQFNVPQGAAAHSLVPGKRRVCPFLESWSTIRSISTQSSF